MTNITLNVTGANVQAIVDGPLTSGMVGIPVAIRYDGIWNSLTKNLVCRCGQWGPDSGETRTVLGIGETATVAHEVMKADMRLYLGIEGYSADGKLVIPTIWADCGKIWYGANAGADSTTNPKLPVWAQMQAEIEQMKENSVTEEKIAAVVEAYLEEHPIEVPNSGQNGSGLSDIARELLITILQNAVYSTDQSGNISALEAELGKAEGTEHVHSYISEVTTAATCTTAGVRTYTCSCGGSYTEEIPATGHQYTDGVCTVCGAVDTNDVTLTGISVEYSGGDVTVGTALTDLTDIVVTAHYSDGTSITVAGYTLSGTISEGENTVNVTYGGMTAVFTVHGVAESSDKPTLLYSWDLTKSLTDTVSGVTAALSGSGAKQDGSGLTISDANSFASFAGVWNVNRIIEIDVVSFEKQTDNHQRFAMHKSAGSGTYDCGLVYRSTGYWQFYEGGWSGDTKVTDSTILNGKTLKIAVDSEKIVTASVEGTILASLELYIGSANDLQIGSESGNSAYNLTVSAIRVYEDV